LSDRGIEIGNGAEPQFAGQISQALVLQIAHRTPPAKASYSDSGYCMPMIGTADPFGHGICFIQFLGRGYDEIAQ
jgi:hypothetical protein